MPALDIQRRGQQIGRIRIGQMAKAANGKSKPVRLETFRFTTKNRRSADAIAELYGGEVRQWNDEWEVITELDVIGVTVPPRDQVVSQWYEWWNKGGCLRRCDSQREQISGKDCMCPHAEDPSDLEAVASAAKERARLAKLNPPQACALKTRISVMIPDLPGVGIFRIDTGSFYAAGETGDKADLLQMARDHGVFLPAELRIEWRVRVAEGRRTPYPVPVLEILSTFREIASGALAAGGITAQLPPAPGETRRALTSGQTPAAPARPALPAAVVREPDPQDIAQRIADTASQALSRGQINDLVRQAREAKVINDNVCTDPGNDTWEELDGYLHDLWLALPATDQPERGDAA